MKRSIKLFAVAATVLVVGLGYQSGLPGWAYASVVAGTAATAGAWHQIGKKAAYWMPDKDFPHWMLASVSSKRADRKRSS